MDEDSPITPNNQENMMKGAPLNTINDNKKQRNNNKCENKIWTYYLCHKCKIIEFTSTIC